MSVELSVGGAVVRGVSWHTVVASHSILFIGVARRETAYQTQKLQDLNGKGKETNQDKNALSNLQCIQ